MVKLLLHNAPVMVVPESVQELRLDAPLEWYRNLEEALSRLKSLKTLLIKIHFEKHHSSGKWPYGKLDPCSSLGFLRGVNSLAELKMFFLHKLSDGTVLATLPNLSKIEVGYRTRFDLAWVEPSKIQDLSIGLTKTTRNHGILSEMVNLRELGVDNLKGEDLGVFSRMAKLEVLGVAGVVESLEGIGGAKSLLKLGMNTLKFKDYGDFDHLRKLQEVEIQSSYNFTSLEPLRSPNLRSLVIYGTKTRIQNLESVKPLTRCPSLEKFVFGGIIDDDDIRPLLELPNLKDCLLNPRYRAMIDVVEKDPARRKIFRL